MKIFIQTLENFPRELYEKYFNMADIQRQNSVNRMKIPDDRKRSILGEMLARKAIYEICGINQEEIEFYRTEKGKPCCKNANVFFSISHSKNYVVCVADKNEIGVDIEFIRPVEPRITRISCTESDKEYIFGTSNPDLEALKFTDESLLRFFKVWTAKEAYFKYLGTGIEGLRTVSYKEISPLCTTVSKNGFVLSIYSKEKSEINFENIL